MRGCDNVEGRDSGSSCREDRVRRAVIGNSAVAFLTHTHTGTHAARLLHDSCPGLYLQWKVAI